MNCLLTGGAGFIGSHLSERLLAQGQTVVNVDNFNDYYDPEIKRRNVAPLLRQSNYTLFEGDILDRASLEKLFRDHKFEAVIHLAARAGATKKAGEQMCYTYHHLYGLRVSCLRFFTVYGPRQRPDMAIHKFTRMIANGEKVPMYGDGSSKRDYTFVADIIDGIEAAIAHCNSYHIYNLGESRTIDLKSLINLIQEYLGKKAVIEQLPPQPGDVPITFADISKAQREIGYSPRVDIQEGVRRFVEWYKENHPVAS